MNLNTLFSEPTLSVQAIVSHLHSHFGFQPGNSMELILAFGNGTEHSLEEALRHWIVDQCHGLRDNPPEYPLYELERRLHKQLLDLGYDPSDIALPSPAAQRIHGRLPNPDLASAIASRIGRRTGNGGNQR